ncbi:MAG: WG repeat-containing protein [Bacteroidia bacterium]|nr:WG repeat-containing protein [Bacteroidia bacterium]
MSKSLLFQFFSKFTYDKRVFTVVFFIFLYSNYFSQPENHLFPYCKAGVWGFADSSGKLIVKPEYQFAGAFFDGMALVKKDNFYGYVNEKGKVVIPLKNSQAENFSNGFAKISAANVVSVIDKNGKEVSSSKKNAEAEDNLKKKFSKKYNRFVIMENGLFLALKDTQVLVSKKEGQTEKKIVRDTVLQAVLDMKGNVIIPSHLWKIKILCYDYLLVESEKNAYLYARDGNIALRDVKFVFPFSGGTWRIRTEAALIYLDSAKNLLLSFKPEYNEVGNFVNGRARFSVIKRERSFFGIVKTDGTEVIAPRYSFVGDLHEGHYVVQDNKGLRGTLDTNGKPGIPMEYSVVCPVSEDCALTKKEGVWKYVDIKGKELFKANFSYSPVENSEYLFASAKYLSGAEFCFHEGLAAFENNGKFGFINRNGACAIEATFDFAEPFRNGIAAVYKKSGSGNYECIFIDKKGNEIIKLQRDFDANFFAKSMPGTSPAFVKYFLHTSFVFDGKSGWIMLDKSGKKLTDKILSAVHSESWLKGIFFYVALENGEWVMMRSDGKIFSED